MPGWVTSGCWPGMWRGGQMQRYEEDDLDALGCLAMVILVVLVLVFAALLAVVLWLG